MKGLIVLFFFLGLANEPHANKTPSQIADSLRTEIAAVNSQLQFLETNTDSNSYTIRRCEPCQIIWHTPVPDSCKATKPQLIEQRRGIQEQLDRLRKYYSLPE